MRPQPLQSIMSSFRFAEGVAMIRGEPMPVVNLALLLGDREPARPERLVTLKLGVRSAAIAVQSVQAIRTLDARLVVDLPPLLRDAGAEHIERLARLDAELALVLRSGRLVPEALWTELDRAGGVE
jgi:purine-binding chemotaxis protein CheW